MNGIVNVLSALVILSPICITLALFAGVLLSESIKKVMLIPTSGLFIGSLLLMGPLTLAIALS